jgi:hypothetical protein
MGAIFWFTRRRGGAEKMCIAQRAFNNSSRSLKFIAKILESALRRVRNTFSAPPHLRVNQNIAMVK